MRLTFYNREHGHELGHVETGPDGTVIPSNEYAKKRMSIHLGDHVEHIRPEHGDAFMQALTDYYKRSSGVAIRLDGDSQPQ